MKMYKTTRSRSHLKRYSVWNYVLLLLVLVSSVVYALPNVYGNDPSILISTAKPNVEIQTDTQQFIRTLLGTEAITVKSSLVDNDRLLIRFNDVNTQFKAYDLIKSKLPNSHTVSYLLASRSPHWLSAIGAFPMKLGLDLQGGVHLLYEVDMEEAINKAEERYIAEYQFALRKEAIRYKKVNHFNSAESRGIQIDFMSDQDLYYAETLLKKETPEMNFTSKDAANTFTLIAKLPENTQKEIKQRASEKNISVFRNRANELGISEPIVQKQGKNRIVVELPGVQDPDHVKDILGSTATLEFRLVQE
jgi:preprotein translocase subunit SecD